MKLPPEKKPDSETEEQTESDIKLIEEEDDEEEDDEASDQLALALALSLNPVHPGQKLFEEGIALSYQGLRVQSSKKFEAAAELKHPYAILCLGRMYTLGLGVPKSPEKIQQYHQCAIPIIPDLEKQANEEKNAQAQLYLGIANYYGVGVKCDFQQAAKYFEAASTEYPEAKLLFSEMLRDGKGIPKNEKRSLELLTELKNSPFIPGKFRFYKQQLDGIGMKKAVESAVAGLKELDEKNNFLDAQQLIADHFFRYGTPQEKRRVVPLLQKAAEQEHLESMAYLGGLHILALDPREKMTVLPVLPSPDIPLGLAYLYESANLGHAPSQYRLGEFHRLGRGGPQNFTEAKKWYALAASQGQSYSQCELGKLYEIEKDYKQAFSNYQKAADQNHPEALCKLGNCYRNGRLGLEKDEKTAVTLYTQSSNLGCPEAHHRLGECHRLGIGGLPKDPQKINTFFMMAKQGGYLESITEPPIPVVAPQRHPSHSSFSPLLIYSTSSSTSSSSSSSSSSSHPSRSFGGSGPDS